MTNGFLSIPLPLPSLTTIAETAGSQHPVIWLIATIHLCGFGLVVYDCLRHRRKADSALLWIFIAWSFTILGALLYLYFGVDRLPGQRHRRNRRDRELDDELKSREHEEMPLLYWRHVHEAARATPESELCKSITRSMNAVSPDHPLLAGNRIRPLIGGDESYPVMLEAIRTARHHIHLESFIIGADDVGRQFLDELCRKAREGVQVRVLYDRFGSTPAVWEGFFKKYQYIDHLRIIGFTQANLFRRQFAINLRNHRKILVIDGLHAFTGGTNLSIDNINRENHPGIQDYHFFVHGPIVQELQYTFLKDWYSMTRENPADLLTASYFPEIPMEGSAMMRLINSGPTTSEEPVTSAIFSAFTQARKQILAVTPYFVPTEDILFALKAAAQRGVDTRLIVPQENNHFYAGLASCALYEEMLECGVQIYERHPPFSHAKSIVVDDVFTLIGSANLDVRSLRLNFETCLSVHDENFAGLMKSIILNDQAVSSRVHLPVWQDRPYFRRLMENAASLLTPML